MHNIDAQLRNLLERDQIRRCVIALARGEDRRDAALIATCLWPDSTSDYGIFAGSFTEYLAWVVPGSPAIVLTQHALGQSLIELKDDDTARTETEVTSYHRINMGNGERDIVIGGRYLDRMAKRAGEWRIAHRTMLYDWFQDLGASIDWSKGVLGLPFSASHYAGRAVGDYSETFFDQGAPRR